MGIKYSVPRQASPHLMHVPLYIACKQNPDLNIKTTLSFMYCRSNRMFDLFKKVTEKINSLHHCDDLEINEIKEKSFIGIHIQKINKSDWIVSQYKSITLYPRKEIEKKGLYISICRKNEKTKSSLKPSMTSLRKPLQDITDNANNANAHILNDNDDNDDEDDDDDYNDINIDIDFEDKLHQKLEERIAVLCEQDLAFEHYHEIIEEYVLQEKKLYNFIEQDYIKEIQSMISWKHRSILIDWLIEVQLEYEFSNRTLFTAINYIDCYLSKKKITDRKNIHVLGIAALLIASKTLEIIPLNMNDSLCIAENLYSTNTIMKMEKSILNVINWNAFQITPFCFLSCWSNVLGIHDDSQFIHCVEFIIHSFVTHRDYINVLISKLVSCSIYLAAIYLDKTSLIDLKLLVLISGHHHLLSDPPCKQMMDIHNVIIQIIKAKDNASLSAVYTKYSQKELNEITKLKFEISKNVS